MNKAVLLGCVAVVLLVATHPLVADETSSPKYEFKAVAFNSDPADATKLLNELHAAGWEYVGPLANGLVAFKRLVPTAADAAIKKEVERMQGTWMTVSTEVDGQQSAEDKRLEKLTIAGNHWTLKLDGEVSQEGTFKIVETGGKFLKVDFIVTDGFKQGDTWISIVQVDGDKVKWSGCYITESKVRPKTLTTQDSDGYFLRTMKRSK